MANISVLPERFVLVTYEAADIASFADRVASGVGFEAGDDIHLIIDETTPLRRTRLTNTDPVTIAVEGGAFENPKVPRALGEEQVLSSLIEPVFQAHDRLRGGFGDAPAENKLTLAQRIAWDIYCHGRASRVNLPVQKQRLIYAFRNRHGFNDKADAVFDRLFTGQSLTWADIEVACAETAAARTA